VRCPYAAPHHSEHPGADHADGANRYRLAANFEHDSRASNDRSRRRPDIHDDRPSHQSGGDFDVAPAGWIGDYSDPQNFPFLFESGNGKFD
jgi:hypothetical protein